MARQIAKWTSNGTDFDRAVRAAYMPPRTTDAKNRMNRRCAMAYQMALIGGVCQGGRIG